MTRQKYYYATCYGTLYRFTRKQWLAFCNTVSSTGYGSLTDHGAEIVGACPDVTDWQPEDAAREMLARSMP